MKEEVKVTNKEKEYGSINISSPHKFLIVLLDQKTDLYITQRISNKKLGFRISKEKIRKSKYDNFYYSNPNTIKLFLHKYSDNYNFKL